MAKQYPCPHCHHPQLQRIGVRGIRQCPQCQTYVDLRSKNWLKQLIAGLAA